jgi:hypothetical protein
VEFKFSLINKGKSDLILHKVSDDCQCTATVFSPNPVKKGKRGTITVKLRTKDIRRGAFERELLLYSNDPAHPITLLKVKGSILIPGEDTIQWK